MYSLIWIYLIFYCKQKTAYEMRISDWSSDVFSSDLGIDVDTADQPAQLRNALDMAAGIVGERREQVFDFAPIVGSGRGMQRDHRQAFHIGDIGRQLIAFGEIGRAHV